MTTKKEKLRLFYEQCTQNGFTDMTDELQAQEAETIAAELKLKYKSIADLYAEAEEKNRGLEMAAAEEFDAEAGEETAEKSAGGKLAVLAIALTVLTVAAAITAGILFRNLYLVPNGSYNQALSHYQAGELDKAQTEFRALGNFKDSAQMVVVCENAKIYRLAQALENQGEDFKAVIAYGQIQSFSDAAEKMRAIQNRHYSLASELEQQGDFLSAYEIYRKLEDYSDSRAKASECRDKTYAQIMDSKQGGHFADAYTLMSRFLEVTGEPDDKGELSELAVLAKDEMTYNDIMQQLSFGMEADHRKVQSLYSDMAALAETYEPAKEALTHFVQAVIRLGRSEQRYYDAAGRLIAAGDASLVYDEAGKLSKLIKDELELNFDEEGWPLPSDDYTCTWTADKSGKVTSVNLVINATGAEETYTLTYKNNSVTKIVIQGTDCSDTIWPAYDRYGEMTGYSSLAHGDLKYTFGWIWASESVSDEVRTPVLILGYLF